MQDKKAPENIKRTLDLRKTLEHKSCFLFGPCQTGKSWLIRKHLPDCRLYDLLDSEVFLNLSQNPKRLEQELTPKDKIVVIDEIQKLPALLDEVYRLIEKYRIRFLMTGSSARKLHRGGVNLLGGRARSRYLHPFTHHELGNSFDLSKALNHGLLPSIYFSDSPEEDLKAYAGDYLQHEIAAEGFVRNIPAFSRFLQVAALCNGKILNYSKIANDAQVPPTTIQEYFHVLRDTLIAFDVPAWKQSVKRKALATSKCYFFDGGLVRHLQNRSWIREKSPEFGEAFETYIAHELKAFCDHHLMEGPSYWRSTSNFEVDFILENKIAIEVKAKTNVTDHDLKGLLAIQEENKLSSYLVITLEKTPRKIGRISILPWQIFLERLWARDWV